MERIAFKRRGMENFESRAEQSRAEQSRAEQSRATNLEILRIVSMLLIVAGHSVTHGGFNEIPRT